MRPISDARTVFLAGDSTVAVRAHEPYAGWGQMLPRFFGPGVAVADHTEFGRTLRSFAGQRRLDKVRSTMMAGDDVFVLLGHSDQRDPAPGACCN